MGLLRRGLQGKSPEQIQAMRAAGLVVGRALELVHAVLRPGMSTGELDRIAEKYIRDQGAVPSFLGYHGFTGTLCISVNDEVVHGIPGSRIIDAGDLVSVDCGAIVGGWHGDAAITVVAGGPQGAREEDVALSEVTREAMWAGIAALRSGSRLYDVGAAAEDIVTVAAKKRSQAYGIIEEYVGHGIGTQMHMDPQVPNYRVRDKGPTVPTGLTVAIEPMLTLGSTSTHVLDDGWTVKTDDGSRAAHWENTVAVTADGLWVLTELDGGQSRLEALGVPYAPLG